MDEAAVSRAIAAAQIWAAESRPKWAARKAQSAGRAIAAAVRATASRSEREAVLVDVREKAGITAAQVGYLLTRAS